MRYFRLLLIAGLSILIKPAFAEDDHSLMSGSTQNYIGFAFIVAMLLLLIVAMLVLLKTFRVLTRIILKAEGYSEQQIAAELKPVKSSKKADRQIWNKLLSLRPLAEEKELIIEHQYDGIQELDNPTPTWFMVLFYSTIVFAAVYLLVYHVFGVGQLQYAEYKTEVAQAEVAKTLYLSKQANRVDENTVKLVTDQAVLSDGKSVFSTTCMPCHGEHAEGKVGPNLTDDYWLHGGKINEVFKTIKYGVPAKGMPNWEKQLSAKQIADVANYIKSLHGTNPPNAKEPQGTKETDAEPAPKKPLVSEIIKK